MRIFRRVRTIDLRYAIGQMPLIRMKKLSLSELANLAEIVGAAAIVVSLIYVGQELKANTAAVQAASLQSITNSSSVSMLAVVENGDFADIRLRGDQEPTDSATSCTSARCGFTFRMCGRNGSSG